MTMFPTESDRPAPDPKASDENHQKSGASATDKAPKDQPKDPVIRDWASI